MSAITAGDFTTIRYETSADHVATITLDRPDQLNSFTETMCAEMVDVWGIVRDTDDVHVAILRANGERAFCTGIDIKSGMWWGDKNIWTHEDPGASLGPRSNKVWKPVVCAVQGMCAGGAFYWIADCDIVVCSPEATFFDPHVTYGLVAALEPIALRYRMPFSDVMRMALLGLHERMTAERALSIGLVTEIIERPKLLERTQELATAIAGQPPAAVQGTVKALWQSLDLNRAQSMATALMYTQVGNPIGTAGLDRSAVKRNKPWLR
jgi:enoyl-CoA hydratase/carnithine racemase